MKILFDRPLVGKVLVLSRSLASKFEYDKPWACISIASDLHEFPFINESNRQDMLRLVFEDLDAVPGPAWAEVYHEDHANKVLDFLCNNWKSVDLLMIHCYAGQSRSAGIGKFICDILQPNYLEEFNRHFSMPNKLVYTKLKEAFNNSFETYKKEK